MVHWHGLHASPWAGNPDPDSPILAQVLCISSLSQVSSLSSSMAVGGDGSELLSGGLDPGRPCVAQERVNPMASAEQLKTGPSCI